ncbi:hypothetical protein Caci_2915 [Catenulispora acidiphila DSM 44928]|uniref:Uncharacterized protein n=1 Tax=Catenulispora acidiphila (strain DSM 44928 / JCM 14897 / NBRC 102108 / NRRL B-24433 / ID139908) TaxID=479433 RepID=C7Q2T2_CATAD|nr:hypothetical protein [Catenulispora acidiphila]ACU71824.1 hypothetical protein Caci_2915 [Catenulispora acidiphila DSM 44928]
MTEHDIPALVQVLQLTKGRPEWSAWDADGNWYYLRYRLGSGTVHISPGGPAFGASDQDFVNALDAARLLTDFVYGNVSDGEITLPAFLRMAGMRTAA